MDEAIVICYSAPRSYTGENCVEMICHGGWITPARIVRAAVDAGARPADPGEFTRRAVLNGRLDLLQAEAVNDLIRAKSGAGAVQALRQLDGGLSDRIVTVRDQILELEALVAYEIDFPEEDDGPVAPERIEGTCGIVIESIERLIATSPTGELVREGALVAIVGAPNVGKSSLFNALLGHRRALVTDIPGTTRDAIEAVLDVMPVALRLADTAGLRETTDVVERLGVGVSREYIANAHVVVACGDSTETLAAVAADARGVGRGAVVLVRTKIDLMAQGGEAPDEDAIRVSAKTGEGLENLIQCVSAMVAREFAGPPGDSSVVTHARHRQVLIRARDELAAFLTARTGGSIPATVSAVHLREGVRVLEELIGAVSVDEILGKLFGAFCVGK